MFISLYPPPPPINTHNHCVGIRNHCVGQFTSKKYTRNHCVGQLTSTLDWKVTVRAPCLSGVPPPVNTHNHCVGTPFFPFLTYLIARCETYRLLVYLHPHFSIFDIYSRPLQNVPPRWIHGTVGMKAFWNMLPVFDIFSRPLWNIPPISLSTPPFCPYLTYLVARCKTSRLAEYTAL